MLTVAQIAERYGLTERQVRWRLTQLDGLLHSHLFTGANGRVTLDDAGAALFDRLIQLEREGLSLSTAVNRLREELGNMQMAKALHSDVKDASCRACAAYREHLQHLEAEVAWLRKQIEELELRALPPPHRGFWARLFGR